jgi:hypothetical protein
MPDSIETPPHKLSNGQHMSMRPPAAIGHFRTFSGIRTGYRALAPDLNHEGAMTRRQPRRREGTKLCSSFVADLRVFVSWWFNSNLRKKSGPPYSRSACAFDVEIGGTFRAGRWFPMENRLNNSLPQPDCRK